METTRLQKLITELTKPLPGISAHSKMMPEGRPIINNPKSHKDAAVAILIYKSNKNIDEIVFIKRNEYEGHHSGQVSFPGGKADSGDGNLINTALRECYEEIGVKLSKNELIGSLTPLYVIVSEFMIYPFIFYIPFEPAFQIDRTEVNYLIRFPFREIILPELRKEKMMVLFGKDYQVPYYDINNEIVWGATAMILAELIEILQKV